MLTLIVPGKHQVKNMDVYIVPFIDEMQLLWKGIRMYENHVLHQIGPSCCMV